MLPVDTEAWRYGAAVPDARKEWLSAPCCFKEIVASIRQDAGRVGGIEFKIDLGKSGMRGCWRPYFHLNVEVVTGDQFFNSLVGYRAQYATSVDRGESANRALISALLPLLLRAARIDTDSSICTALCDNWAKAWIWQKRKQFHQCLEPTEPEIMVPRWIANRQEAIDYGIDQIKRLSRANRPLVHKAIWGVRLHGPITKLVVIGAWINHAGQVTVPGTEKQRRSHDIHEFGFA